VNFHKEGRGDEKLSATKLKNEEGFWWGIATKGGRAGGSDQGGEPKEKSGPVEGPTPRKSLGRRKGSKNIFLGVAEQIEKGSAQNQKIKKKKKAPAVPKKVKDSDAGKGRRRAQIMHLGKTVAHS